MLSAFQSESACFHAGELVDGVHVGGGVGSHGCPKDRYGLTIPAVTGAAGRVVGRWCWTTAMDR